MPAFKNAGVKAPATWTEFTKNAGTIKASGVPPYSIGGADGWTLTDLFENIYLRQAGPARYALLTLHKIKWTDASVTAALNTMAQVIGTSANMAGGTSGAVQTDFPTSVNNVWESPPKAAMVLEGDFVPGVATVKSKPGTGYNQFPFPSINNSPKSVVIGGDTIVAFRDNPAIESFVKFLGTPAAAAAWAAKGGFATGNKHMPSSVYPDATTRATASAIAAGEVRRVRHVRPAARVVRRDGRPGRVGSVPGLPPQSEGREGHPVEARVGGGSRLEEREVTA